jgi:uncharacterized protein (DUF924 family)
MTPDTILDFWFGTPDSPEYGRERKEWFLKDAQFDEQIRSRFLSHYRQAAAGELDAWQTSPLGCLALIITLDQFPRNLFRGKPESFATDQQALALAEWAVEREFDRSLLSVQRWFIYLPFEHSEDIAVQRRSLELWEGLRDDPGSIGAIDYARRHYEVIARFERFPHRNAILGRQNTLEEEEFLQQPGSSF